MTSRGAAAGEAPGWQAASAPPPFAFHAAPGWGRAVFDYSHE